MAIGAIAARAFSRFSQCGETTGIERCDEVDTKIERKAVNISTELAIKNIKDNHNQDGRDTVPAECHHLEDVSGQGEKTPVLNLQPLIDLGIDIGEGEIVPVRHTKKADL